AAVHTLFELVQQILRGAPRHEVLLQVVVPVAESWRFAALTGLLKTAHLENPNLIAQWIAVDDASVVERALGESAAMPHQQHVRYERGERQIASWAELDAAPAAAPWKDGGVYLITGGAGGLGQLLAR